MEPIREDSQPEEGRLSRGSGGGEIVTVKAETPISPREEGRSPRVKKEPAGIPKKQPKLTSKEGQPSCKAPRERPVRVEKREENSGMNESTVQKMRCPTP